MKKTIIIALIVTGLSLAAIAVKLHGPVSEARASCQVLRTFADYVDRAEWNDAKAMLETDPEKFRIEDGKVLYWNRDIRVQMGTAKPKFWKTLEYYLTDRKMGDKVIFNASSRADYATIKNGKITFIKTP